MKTRQKRSVPIPIERVAEGGLRTVDAVEIFLRHCKSRLSERTQKTYRFSLWQFCESMPEYVRQITAEHIDRYIAGRKILNSSKNTELIAIKSLFTYLHEFWEFDNVAKRVKELPVQPFRQRMVSDEEIKRILEVAKPRERLVIKFLANTGLRATEFSEFVPSCISAERKYITIIGKGRKRRVVPLNDTARDCIPGIFYKKWTRDKLSWLCHKLSQKADIPLFGPHALRHYFVTTLIRKGVNLSVIAKIVGHSSTLITEKVYCHLTTPDFLGVTDILDA